MLENIKDATKKEYIAVDDKSINSDDEYKSLLNGLKDMQEEMENPAVIYQKQDNKKMEDFYLEAKKDILKALLQRAQILSPHQYTKGSWGNFIACMKQAMQMSKCGNAQVGTLNRAVALMYRALTGLRYNNLGKKEFKNLKKSLPNDNILQKKSVEQEKNDITKPTAVLDIAKQSSTGVLLVENLDVQI